MVVKSAGDILLGSSQSPSRGLLPVSRNRAGVEPQTVCLDVEFDHNFDGP
jgi:hypothetical protein